MKLTFLSLLGALVILLAATPLPAHHSFAATYMEDAQPTEIKGTLKSFRIQNPHSYIQIEDEKLTDKEGNPVRWVVEWGAAAQLATQDVSATATAKVLHGNAAKCMRPFAVLDKWDEYDVSTNGAESEYAAGAIDPDWNFLTSTFDKYDSHAQENDLYVRPSICNPPDPNCPQGTGFRPFDQNGNAVDYGREIEIHTGAQDQNSSGWFQPIRLHAGDSGAADYCMRIKECNQEPIQIGQVVDTENGNMVGPTDQCLFSDSDSLYNQDPTAHWEPDYFGPGKGAVVGPQGVNSSPRIIPLPVVDPDEFFATDPNGHTSVTVRNILGFFIERQDGHGGHTVTVGRLINVPGQYVGGGMVDTSSSFITQIILIR